MRSQRRGRVSRLEATGVEMTKMGEMRSQRPSCMPAARQGRTQSPGSGNPPAAPQFLPEGNPPQNCSLSHRAGVPEVLRWAGNARLEASGVRLA